MNASLIEPSRKPIPVSMRLGTMLLDHVVICFIGIPPIILLQYFTHPNSPFDQESPFVMMPLFVIYFCKDCVGGRSPAKRILKLAVIDKSSNLAPSPLQCLVRNLLDIVWPIEVIVALFNQRQRIGDHLAGTELTYYNPSKPNKIKILQIVIAILMATGFTYLLMIAFRSLLLT